jgi:hypothetical protein
MTREDKLTKIVRWIYDECDSPIDEIEYLIEKAFPNSKWLDNYDDIINLEEK